MKFKSTSSSLPPPPTLFGQQTLRPHLFSKSTRPHNNEENAANITTRKRKCVSLSDFLSRKLGDTTPSGGTGSSSVFREKKSCFSFIRSGSNAAVGIQRDDDETRSSDGGVVGSFVDLDGSILRKFHQIGEKECDNEAKSALKESGEPEENSRKRKKPFSAENEMLSAPKHLVVLGDDPKPKQKGISITGKNATGRKQSAFFNHYGNGNGWWDCDREGVEKLVVKKHGKEWDPAPWVVSHGIDTGFVYYIFHDDDGVQPERNLSAFS